MSRPGVQDRDVNLAKRCPAYRRPNCRDHDVPMRQLAAAMTPEDSYAYYYSLADQQHQVHASRADIDAFLVFDTDTDFLWDPKEFSVTPKLITRHGFCSALRMLAKRERHKVVEFVVEDQAYTDGVNIDLFDSTGYTYADVISLIQRPGFSRLLRSLELRFFTFSSPYSLPPLLLDMRQRLGWGKRPVAMRPKVTFVWAGPTRLEGQIVKHVS
ncbi:hypothetical protein FOC1_g10006796 [Fusarium oxysporum f. sp. cubense race 1]|uniref:Uncharacterized protein n=1 Tax=Fusarium oxysporum f. sp. cubense (strain race 1) TaxID=1229664 RepID=N4TPB2_FUSC1|nr:hypothetical protein FOC1_g10006796 [Fusarium oxysporum f. sp. cubense race 1]